MIGADPHGRAVFLADLHQWRKPFANAIDLFQVFGIGIFDLLKFFLIDIVALGSPALSPLCAQRSPRHLA
jgi:hypothetical protein